ncbi:MAG: F0F1 ATP synthase subunit A [Bdellovibrionales bacterium]|nr:F0F1 ATP synthase subunit A [Bdellovibrionales bacterium]
MEGHYTYLGDLFHLSENHQEFFTGILMGVGMLALGWLGAKNLSRPDQRKGHLIPKKFSITAFFDLCFEAFINYHDSLVGKDGRKYASFSAAIFFFLFFSNLFSLIPGMAAATTTVWLNVGMAIVVFIYFNAVGIKAQGLKGYLLHFCGPMLPIAWLIFPVEIFSTCLRILTLNLRLYWNINADHVVLGIFTDMLSGFAFPMYVLATFVSFMQAFIFTTLTMVYILLAQMHEEDH